jgi:hypothetical protein
VIPFARSSVTVERPGPGSSGFWATVPDPDGDPDCPMIIGSGATADEAWADAERQGFIESADLWGAA